MYRGSFLVLRHDQRELVGSFGSVQLCKVERTVDLRAFQIWIVCKIRKVATTYDYATSFHQTFPHSLNASSAVHMEEI